MVRLNRYPGEDRAEAGPRQDCLVEKFQQTVAVVRGCDVVGGGEDAQRDYDGTNAEPTTREDHMRCDQCFPRPRSDLTSEEREDGDGERQGAEEAEQVTHRGQRKDQREEEQQPTRTEE